jgi:FxsC-like protein
MPDYSFFFSYTRIDRLADPGENIKKFYDDLHRRMQLLGYRDGGFFDTEGINSGEEWCVKLEQALASCRILVAMYSPSYFQSPYCGKEWQAFHEIHKKYLVTLPRGVTSPDVILPVKWIPTKSLPGNVGKMQYSQENYARTYAEEGLLYLMNRFKRFKEEYTNFLDTFAKRLRDMADAQGARTNTVISLSETPPAFPLSSNDAQLDTPRANRGSRYVKFVFVAGMKNEMSTMSRKCKDGYGEELDRKDWKPSYPDEDEEAGMVAAEIAIADKRFSEFLVPSQNLMSEIRDAEKQNNIVILVVDPWSVNLITFRQFLSDYDRNLLTNCGVIVHWNQKDSETVENIPILRLDVGRIFRRQIALSKSYFSDEVNSLEDFRRALVVAFQRIRGCLIQEGKGLSAEQGSPIQKPVISNQTGA